MLSKKILVGLFSISLIFSVGCSEKQEALAVGAIGAVVGVGVSKYLKKDEVVGGGIGFVTSYYLYQVLKTKEVTKIIDNILGKEEVKEEKK